MNPRSRAASKIVWALPVAALALGAFGQSGGTGEASPRRAGADLRHAELSQSGRQLVLTVRTGAPLALERLEPLPRTRGAAAPHLCWSLRGAGRRGQRRLCLGGPKRRAHKRVGLLLVNAAGRTTRKSLIAARVKRRGPRTLALVLAPERAGLSPQRYRWRVVGNRRGCRGCGESLPSRGDRSFRLRPVRAIGCSGGSGGLVRHGPRDRRAIALTFDDGPSSYTDAFVSLLRRKGARGTFFVLGQEVAGRGRSLRRIVRGGSEIANHSTHHSVLPDHWDLAATNALIRAATGFRPCLFRPPGGVVNGALVATAGRAGLRTVLWDVDPADWSNPGSGAVAGRVIDAVRPGSIVVMHDGGGNRSGTLAALPAILDALRARGYRFVTVSELLGQRLIYRPYA